MFLLPQMNQPMCMHVFNLLQNKLYVLLIVKPLILVGR